MDLSSWSLVKAVAGRESELASAAAASCAANTVAASGTEVSPTAARAGSSAVVCTTGCGTFGGVRGGAVFRLQAVKVTRATSATSAIAVVNG